MKPTDLRAWVSEGNTAILFCPFENAHMEEFRLRLDTGPEGTTVDATEPGAAINRLHFQSRSRFDVENSTIPLKTLFATAGRPAVLEGEVGAGRILWIADAHLATNQGLADEDNAPFLVRAAEPARAGGEVIFDETSTRLEMGEPGVMAYARKSGLQPVFIELGLLALFGIWHFASRAAPPVAQRAKTPPAVPDYVTGRARLYEKAALGRSAVKALSETLRDALHRTPGVAPEAQVRGAALLDRARGLERFRVAKPNDLVELARSIHDFMNEVIWKPGRRFRRASRTAPSKRR